MRILFYSTNSNGFDGNALQIVQFPHCYERLELLQKNHPKYKFIVATQKPGMFLLDLEKNELIQKANGIEYYFIPNGTLDDDVEFLFSLKIDVAIAMSFWLSPYDWLSLHDAEIGERLLEKGIKVLCHSVNTALTCFDKWRTYQFLKSKNFNTPATVYVHHEMFTKVRRDVALNVYKESVLQQIKSLHFPVVIKDVFGLSSYGMDVVQTYEDAEKILFSKKNNGDRIVQEFIQGLQFGTEIYGTKNNYNVLPPLLYSVNKYGITSPKQSIKLGPITNKKFLVDDLQLELLRLAKNLNLCGSAQIDIVFSKGSWFIIEVNPRLSGSSEMFSLITGKSIFETMLSIVAGGAMPNWNVNTLKDFIFMNYKFPLLTYEQIKKVRAFPFVKYVRQIQNFYATQDREKGYCEVILMARKIDEIKFFLNQIASSLPEIIEPIFFERAFELIEKF